MVDFVENLNDLLDKNNKSQLKTDVDYIIYTVIRDAANLPSAYKNALFLKMSSQNWIYRAGVDCDGLDNSLKNIVFAEKFFDEKFIYMVLKSRHWRPYIKFETAIEKFLLIKHRAYIHDIIDVLDLSKDVIVDLFYNKVDASSLHSAGLFWPYITDVDRYNKLVLMIQNKSITQSCIDQITFDGRALFKSVDADAMGWYKDDMMPELKALLDILKHKILSIEYIYNNSVDKDTVDKLVNGYMMSSKSSDNELLFFSASNLQR